MISPDSKKDLILLYNGIGTAWASAASSPSVSLMGISAYLRGKGYSTALLCDEVSDEELRDLLSRTKAVGFSVFTGPGINQALLISKRIDAITPGIPKVWGGYHATLEPDQTIRHPLVDYVIRGEGESAFCELLGALDSGSDVSTVAGLSYKLDGHPKHNSDRPAGELSELPLPDYDLYEEHIRRSGEMPYISSRGCPFDCRFCCNAKFNRSHGLRFRQLPMDRVLENLHELCARFAPRKVLFWDDMFLSSPKRAEQFLHGYKDSGFNFEWTAFTRCDVFNRFEDSVLKGLKAIGLGKLCLGVESGSDRMLKYLGKKLVVEDVLRAVRKMAELDLPAEFSFVCGFPGETREDVEASLRLRNEIKRILASGSARFFVYTPMPGADVVDDCRRRGYEPPATLEDWSDFEFHAFNPPWLDGSHVRLIRNISYASMFDNFSTEPFSLKAWLPWVLARTGDFRLRHKWLRFAPELSLLYNLHSRKLAGHRRELAVALDG